jgi:hypothetical protein
MIQKTNSYIFIWFSIQIIFITFCVKRGLNDLKMGLHADKTMVLSFLIILFVIFYIKNIFDFITLLKDRKHLGFVLGSKETLLQEKEDYCSLSILPEGNVRNTMELLNGKILSINISKIDVGDVLERWGWLVERRNEVMRHGSSVIVTIGLIGTMAGLIITIGGLEGVLMTLNEAKGTQMLMEELSKTLSGMSTSFYTTLFGAILGGAFLKTIGLITYLAQMQGIYDLSHYIQIVILPFLKREMPSEVTETHMMSLVNKLNDLTNILSDKKTN